MADKTKIGGVEVRTVEVEYGETGVGVSNRTDTEYQLGAEVDGKWVPFATLGQGRVEMFQARADAESAKADEKPSAGKSLGA
jgi:hypothetical protein